MANLKKCKACGAAISKNADSCPQCGEPQKRKPIGCGSAIALVVLVAIVAAMLGGDPSDTSSTPKPPPTAAELRQQQIERQFSAWDGSHYALEKSVKKALKDPDSYQHIETRYSDDGDHITVVMQFRAKNSFGGYDVSTARGTYDLDGNAIGNPTIAQ